MTVPLPRRFLLHLTDGRIQAGCQLPSGLTLLDRTPEGPFLAIDIDALRDIDPADPLHDARVEWIDTTPAYEHLRAAAAHATNEAGTAALRTLGAINRAVRGRTDPTAREVQDLLDAAVRGEHG